MISFRALTSSPSSRCALGRGATCSAHDAATRSTPAPTVRVAGSGVDHLNTAIVHSQEPTPTGMIQKSTEIVELNGDLKGRVLYHVTSVFDFVQGTLVNTETRCSRGRSPVRRRS